MTHQRNHGSIAGTVSSLLQNGRPVLGLTLI